MLLDSKGRRSGCVLQQAGEKFRRLACAYAEKHLYKSAVFWADKVVSILDAQPDDVFFFARTLFLDGQFARAADVITRRNLHFTNDACRVLAADALNRCKLYNQAEAVMFACYEEDITAANVSCDRASRLTSFSRVGKHGEDKASLQKRSEQKSTATTPLSSSSAANAVMPPPSTHSGTSASVANRLLRGSATKSVPNWSPMSSNKFPMSSSTPKAEAVTPVLKQLPPPTPRTNTNSAKRNNVKSVFPTFSMSKDVWANVDARESLVKAQIAEGGENRIGAAEFYKEALIHDPFCQEAFQALIKSYMLSPVEEFAILDVITCHTQMTQTEINLVKALYTLAVRRVDAREDVLPIPEEFVEKFETNTDVMLWRARLFFADSDYRHALKLIKAVQSLDPHHPEIPQIYIACLLELKDVNELFRVAHELVDKNAEGSLTWYAVGCYYYLTDKLEPARRYLLKATTIDKFNGCAWLMYGHAFAVDNEHDQAMSAYYKAHHIMRGCHLPLLYVGLGYENSKSYVLAREFFCESLLIAPNDPFTLHELGIVCFSEKRYEEAEKYMRSALAQIDRSNRLTPFPEKWEPLLNNLGHVCRKLDKVDEALKFHRRALSIKPKSSSTYAAIGYILAWRGQLWSAASHFHQALALRRDDTLSTELLNHVVEALAEEDEVPYLRGPVGPDGPDIAARDLEYAMGPMKRGVKKELKEEEEKFKKYACTVGTDPSIVCSTEVKVKKSKSRKKSRSASKKNEKKSESRTTQTLQPDVASTSAMDMSVSMESV